MAPGRPLSQCSPGDITLCLQRCRAYVHHRAWGDSTTSALQAAPPHSRPLQRLSERKKERKKEKTSGDFSQRKNTAVFWLRFLPPCRLRAFPASLMLFYIRGEQDRHAMKNTPRLHRHCHCTMVSPTPHICMLTHNMCVSKVSGSECWPSWGDAHANSTGIH